MYMRFKTNVILKQYIGIIIICRTMYCLSITFVLNIATATCILIYSVALLNKSLNSNPWVCFYSYFKYSVCVDKDEFLMY